MLHVDDQLWPLGIFIASGEQTLPDHIRMLATWDEWLARGEPFVALRLHRDEASLDHVEGVARMTKQWLRAGADALIRGHVAAMINIVPPGSYERMKHLSVEAVFGVPGGIFPSTSEGLQWLSANVPMLNLDEMSIASIGERLERPC
jgi:hypothetical protein